MGTVILPKDSEFADGQTARGTDVRSNDQYLRDFINNGNIGQANLTKSENYAWTGVHSFTVSNSSTTNHSTTVSAALNANVYGDSVTSSVAQANSPLRYTASTNASSTATVNQTDNAGTGAAIYANNSNTSATDGAYKAVQAGTGPILDATLRSLGSLNATLTAKTQTNTNSVSNSTTETTASDLTTTLPANFLKAGTTLRIKAYATMDTPGSAPATAIVRVKYGGTSGTVLLSTGAVTPTVSLSGALVVVEGLITCISTGASGTVEAQGMIAWQSNTAPTLRGMGTGATGAANTSTVTIDTTAQNDLVLSFAWGTAVSGCTFTWRAGTVEVVK